MHKEMMADVFIDLQIFTVSLSPSLSPSRALSLSLSLYLHPRIAYVYTFIGVLYVLVNIPCMHVCTCLYNKSYIWKLPVTTAMCVGMSQQRWSGCWPQPARLQQQVWEACKMLHSRCSDVFSEVEPILSGLKKQSKTWKDQVQKKARLTRKGCQHVRPPGIPGRRGSMDVMAMRQAMC